MYMRALAWGLGGVRGGRSSARWRQMLSLERMALETPALRRSALPRRSLRPIVSPPLPLRPATRPRKAAAEAKEPGRPQPCARGLASTQSWRHL